MPRLLTAHPSMHCNMFYNTLEVPRVALAAFATCMWRARSIGSMPLSSSNPTHQTILNLNIAFLLFGSLGSALINSQIE